MDQSNIEARGNETQFGMLRFQPSFLSISRPCTLSHPYSTMAHTLTHSSHNHVHYLMLTPLWLTPWLIPLTTMYTISHLLHYDSYFLYLRNVYIDLGIRCKDPDLALLKYTWVPGQVPLRTFILISQYYWDIPSSLFLTVSKLRHSQYSLSQVL